MLCLTGLIACSSAEPVEPDQLGRRSYEVVGTNGLSYNGLSYNGLSYNGLSYNGLSYNGLSYNGLSNPDFAAWFNQDSALAEQVMHYVAGCALPTGQTLTYTNPATSETYTWAGGLGLAPDWASGALPTVAEQQVITACLVAHTNKYQQRVSISVLGRDATGQPIPTTPAELEEYSRREACFFGNLFTGEGVFVGSELGGFNAKESTSRACSLSSNNGGHASNCPPVVHTGTCRNSCTQDPTRQYYTSCTHDGVSYVPLATRLRPQDIFVCGDGTCQISESCGNGAQYDNCKADCGLCL